MVAASATSPPASSTPPAPGSRSRPAPAATATPATRPTTGLVCNVDRLDQIAVAADGRSVTVGAGVKAIDLITTLAAPRPRGAHRLVSHRRASRGSPSVAGWGSAPGRSVPPATTSLAASDRDRRRPGGGGRCPAPTPICTGPAGEVGVETSAWSPRSHWPPTRSRTRPTASSTSPGRRRSTPVQAWQTLAPHASPNLYLICALRDRVRAGPRCGCSVSSSAAPKPVPSGGYVDHRGLGSHDPNRIRVISRPAADLGGMLGRERRRLPDAAGVELRGEVRLRGQAVPGDGGVGMAKAIEARQGQSGSGAVIMDPYGAAINKVAPDATAFVHRDQLFSCQELAYWSAGGRVGRRQLAGRTARRDAPVRLGPGLSELHRPDARATGSRPTTPAT